MVLQNHIPLIIMGMHRSGTSLLANWLYQCGFNLGNEMLGPGNGNDEGHFEDLDILRLHKQILLENSLGYKISKPTKLSYSDITIQQAKDLFNKKKTADCWGWKEPRTCLMMDLWNQIIPNHKIIVIYRDFTQVVDSLIRRKKNHISGEKIALMGCLQRIKYQVMKRHVANQHLKVWIEYNRSILENLKNSDQEDYLVINESTLSDADLVVFNYLQKTWNYHYIHYMPIKNVINPNLLNRKTGKYQFDSNLLEKAKKITHELDHLQHETLQKLLLSIHYPAEIAN